MIEGDGFFSVNTPKKYGAETDPISKLQRVLVDKRGIHSRGEYLLECNLNINKLGEIYQDNEFIDRIVINKLKTQRN